MIYYEKIGDLKIIYKGTPTEIMELYTKMNPKEKPTETKGSCCRPKEDLKKLINDDVNVKERYDNMKHFNLMPQDNPYDFKKPTVVASTLKQIFEPTFNVSCGIAKDKIDIDKIGEEITKKIMAAMRKL